MDVSKSGVAICHCEQVATQTCVAISSEQEITSSLNASRDDSKRRILDIFSLEGKRQLARIE